MQFIWRIHVSNPFYKILICIFINMRLLFIINAYLLTRRLWEDILLGWVGTNNWETKIVVFDSSTIYPLILAFKLNFNWFLLILNKLLKNFSHLLPCQNRNFDSLYLVWQILINMKPFNFLACLLIIMFLPLLAYILYYVFYYLY